MRTTVLAIAAAATSSVAQAQLIVGNDQSGTASIYHVDVGSGVATPIYAASTTDAKPWGMAYDAATNTLYWNSGGTLYQSPYSLGGLVPQSMGSLTYNGTATNYVALSYHDGELLGTRNIATEAVYSINLTSLAATLLYQYPSTFDFGGLDTDAATGKLYGLTDAAAAPLARGLYEFDLAGMTQTFLAPYPAGETDIDALAVHDGRAYYVTDGPNTMQMFFYVYDVATGQQLGTLPSPFTGSGTFSAATFVPGEAPCYPDCNEDNALTIADFACFQTKFVASDPYADCNQDSQFTIADFGCFQGAFVTGCP